jgi:dihydroorotase
MAEFSTLPGELGCKYRDVGAKRKFQVILHKILHRFMKILISQVKITDPLSPFHGSIKDILIDGTHILKIADKISEKVNQTILEQNLQASPGWVDPFADFCDPGYEFRETLDSGAAAAAAGGFTRVFTLPSTKPVVDSKAQVEYIVQRSATLPINIHPLGAITKKTEGKELAEMYDMRNSGAIAFSDGLEPVQSAGLFLKALQYVKAFDGVLVQVPIDQSIGSGGLMNEGIISTQLGLPGLPAIAEELMIKRDLELLRYTQSRLHITAITTQNSIALIKAAKKEGLQVSCSVTPYHLFFSDEDMQRYDTNLKLNPPLRSKTDVIALRRAVLDGTIDCIASHHLPQDWDHKTCEFEYAKPGMLGLQTLFAVINETLPELTDERLVQLFSLNARSIFRLPGSSIAEGAEAEMSLFSKTAVSTLSRTNLMSKSANSPFLDHALKGKVFGIIHKGKLSLNNQP